MKNQTITYLLLLIFLTSISSCKKTDDDSGKEIPSDCTNNTGWIKNGHQFVYINDPYYIFADTLYSSIEEISAGVFKISHRYDDGFIYPVYSAYLKPCKNEIYQGSSAAMANAFVVYHIDGNVNDTWSNTTTSAGGYTITTNYKITGKNVSVTVEAGTFTCLKIHLISTSTQPGSLTTESDYYLNNESGLIKLDGNTAYYELARKNY